MRREQIPVLESQLLFDSRPLEKKVQQRENDLMIRKNLSIAFSQCISSYIISEAHDTKQLTFARQRPKTERQPQDKANQRKNNKKIALKKIFETKKSQIAKLATYVNQQMYNIASSVIEQYKSMSSQKSTKDTLPKQTQSQNCLTESTKNFLIQLFTQTGLLKYYKGMDRSFPTLIAEAQKAYYGVKSFIKSESRVLETKTEKEIKKHMSEMKQDQMKMYDAVSDIISMKKRYQQASLKFEKLYQLEEINESRGYQMEELENFAKDSQILEEDDYMILAETKDTRSGTNRHDDSSIYEGLYFSEFSSRHFEQESEQESDENVLVDHLQGTHAILKRLVSNIKFETEKGQKESKKHQKENQPQKLHFH